MFARWACVAACFCVAADAASWKLARDEHFEIYSQADDSRTQGLLQWLEQLRACFLSQQVVHLDAIPPVRVILFASAKDYEPYRVRELADAHYAGSENRRYIVMAASAEERRIAAHELAHVILYSRGNLPSWLSEGLAEFFSTIRIDEDASVLGADVTAHLQALARHPWIPLSDVLASAAESALGADRERATLFYAESWALVHMLVFSPEYGPRFQNVLESAHAKDAITTVYGKSAEDIERDLHAWIARRTSKTLRLSGVGALSVTAQASEISDFAARSVLADMLAAAGELGRAEALLRDLAREAPEASEISAALGTVALHQGDETGARKAWKRAIAQGVRDADICYRYAVLADRAGLPADEIREALQQAVALRPDFDDAHYRLALLEKNTGHYAAALEQLRAMRIVAPARAFNYWTAMADGLNELGMREDAVAAARKATEHATTSDERALAARLAWFAQTDMTVQFTRDANGRAQMVTTRVPHRSAEDWNPFVEAGDDVRSVSGLLREIDCTAGPTRIRVEADGAVLTLAISDPSRVRMRNAPEELVCGPQENVTVEVQYAASKNESQDGLVRGIEFQGSK